MQVGTFNLTTTTPFTVDSADYCYGISFKAMVGSFTFQGNREFKGMSSAPIIVTTTDPPLQFLVTQNNVPINGITVTPAAGATVQIIVQFV